MFRVKMNLKQTIRRILREENDSRKEENEKKVKFVEKMIYVLYKNVSFIKQSTFDGKPLNFKGKPHLTIYFDSDDTAANIESWFDEKIYRDIKELTSGNIIVCPYWAANWDSRKKEADVYISTELLRYDNLGNVINESSKSIIRILREETELPLLIRRRVDIDELNGLVDDVKSLIDSGYDKTDAIYDTIRQFVASKRTFRFNDETEQQYWDSYIEVEKPLVNYIKSKLKED